MLTFYSHPLSGNARRVWIALLEKNIPFEQINLKLDGDQRSPEFTDINPLQRIPAIVDDGFQVVESLAILDYLEAQYPDPPLMPKDVQSMTKVRMAEMAIATDLQPMIRPLMQDAMQMPVEATQLTSAKERIKVVLNFFENRLLVGDPYFLGANFSLADVVAGTMIGYVPLFGMPLDNLPKIATWLEVLSQRPSWQQTAPPPDALESARERIKQIMKERGEG
jgi:glutathione S-transferase